MRSIMQYAYDMLPKTYKPRSQFNLRHGHKTTMDAGWLVPLFVDMVYPGDTYSCRHTGFIRMTTQINPLMDNIFFETFTFFVPLRLVFGHYEEFFGFKKDIDSTTEYILPNVPITQQPMVDYQQSLYQYMGIPNAANEETYNVQSAPLRGYMMIWNDWFRDQNLQDAVTVPTDDGPDSMADFYLLRRNDRHDYFTGCSTSPQKGDAIELPLGTSAPVFGNDYALKMWDGVNRGVLGTDTALPADITSNQPRSESVVTGAAFVGAGKFGDGLAIGLAKKDWYTGSYEHTGAWADLSEATAATVNSLRLAIKQQVILERDMLYGNRYREHILGHWGVDNQDGRLQRTELINVSSDMVNINVVAQTSPEPAGGSFLADLGSFATCVSHGQWTASFTEHGYLMVLGNVRADITYQYGLERWWSASIRDDLVYPEYAELGMQTVYSREIYCDGSSGDATPWGYRDRFDDRRSFRSRISGQFASYYTVPLDSWHLAKEYASRPVFNSTFIQSNPPIDRVLARPGTAEVPLPQFYVDMLFNMTKATVLPTYSMPMGFGRL